MEITKSRAATEANSFDEIFAALPPLDSPAYLELLANATAKDLPAPVLARAFRQLANAGADAPARITLERLFASQYREQYLLVVRKLSERRAMHHAARGHYADDGDDLFQETVQEIVRVLPTERGAFAETSWVKFCKHCFEDRWRQLYGRRGEKIRDLRVEPRIDPESGQEQDPLDVADDSVPWPVVLRESKLPWLEGFIKRTVAGFKDPLIRQVAEDQFSPDPSPISAGCSETGKPPLTEQLGVDRFRISRAKEKAKIRLAAALIKQKEQELDSDWLRKFYQGK